MSTSKALIKGDATYSLEYFIDEGVWMTVRRPDGNLFIHHQVSHKFFHADEILYIAAYESENSGLVSDVLNIIASELYQQHVHCRKCGALDDWMWNCPYNPICTRCTDVYLVLLNYPYDRPLNEDSDDEYDYDMWERQQKYKAYWQEKGKYIDLEIYLQYNDDDRSNYYEMLFFHFIFNDMDTEQLEEEYIGMINVNLDW